MNKLFTLAFAGLAFAACSNEDSPADNGGNGQNEIVDAIQIRFVSGGASRAHDGVENGLAQENKLFHAFVFAKEAAPKHVAAREGDWTVKEVGNGTVEIPAGNTAGQLGNMATFSGVRQGDNVYVLANYPDMTLADAELLARNGAKSEDKIKAFIANVKKDYLSSLNFSSEATGAPSTNSQYIMAGMGTIPVSPTIPNGETVIVPVKLDREMAKVIFYATVTKDVDYAACNRLEIKNDDGIVVARVARKVSPFTTQGSAWYFPFPAGDEDKDWDIAGWLTPFDGEKQSAADNTQTTVPLFNNELHNADAKEYRYTWDLSNATANTVRAYLNDGWIFSPYFYVSPNYSNDAAKATVIATQATYVGAPVFVNEDANTLFVKTYGKYSASDASKFQNKEGSNAISFSKCVWTDAAMQQVNTYLATVTTDNAKEELAKLCGWDSEADQGKAKVVAAITELAKVTKIIGLASPADDTTIALLDYYDGMKLYYRADIANYDDTNTVSYRNTERNTFYKIRATITSLGAKSIEEAINSDNIGMQVQVEVNPWNVVVNDINM